MNKERFIHIRDLVYVLLGQAKYLLVWLVIGAALGGALGGMMYLRSGKDEKTADQVLEQLENKLEVTDLNAARKAYYIYEAARLDYETNLAYAEQSIKMRVNPQETPTLRLAYSLDCSDVNRPNIASYLTYYVKSDEVIDAVVQKLDGQLTAEYVPELIYAATSANNVMLEVKIIGETKAQCEAVGEVIKECLATPKDGITVPFGMYQLKLTYEQYAETLTSSLVQLQSSQQDKLNSLSKTMENAYIKLTDDQLAYCEALEIKSTEGGNGIAVKAHNKSFPVRYPLFGAVGMVLLGLCWYVVAFVLNFRLRSAYEVEVNYQTPLCSVLCAKAEKNLGASRLNRWFYHSFAVSTEEEKRQVAAKRLQVISHKNGYHKLLLTGVAEQQELGDVLSRMASDDGLTVVYLPNMLNHADTMAQLEDFDAVCLLETVNDSVYAEIEKEIVLTEKMQLPLVGYVAVVK